MGEVIVVHMDLTLKEETLIGMHDQFLNLKLKVIDITKIILL